MGGDNNPVRQTVLEWMVLHDIDLHAEFVAANFNDSGRVFVHSARQELEACEREGLVSSVGGGFYSITAKGRSKVVRGNAAVPPAVHDYIYNC